jgi:transglutaminase-like putative cysteine protease
MRDNKLRILLFLMIAVQTATLGYMARTIWFPAFMLGFALLGLPGWIRFDPSPRRRRFLLYALAFLLFIKARVMGRGLMSEARFTFDYGYSYALAQLALLAQTAALFLKHPDGRFPRWTAAAGVAAMIYSGNRLVNIYPPSSSFSERDVYMALCLVFALLAGLWMVAGARRIPPSRQDRPRAPRALIFGAPLIALSLLIGWSVSLFFISVEQDLRDAVGNFLYGTRFGPSAAGFSNQAWLGSVKRWKTDKDNAVALRVFSDVEPGYLRARVFPYYGSLHRTGWVGEGVSQVVDPAESVPPDVFQLLGGDLVYPVPGSDSAEREERGVERWKRFTVNPVRDLKGVLPLPFQTAWAAVPTGEFRATASGVVDTNVLYKNMRYETLVPRVPAPRNLEIEEFEAFLSLPPRLSAVIWDKAWEIFAPEMSPVEKMRAVVAYFRTNHRYSLEVDYNRDSGHGDPLSWFISEKAAAHCEYFASATAVLLRLADVPTRYVTGFVAVEWNPLGDYWIARNKDAHAWVEAWDEKSGRWMIVESTPSAGVPGEEEFRRGGELSKLWDSLKMFFGGLKKKLFEEGLLKLLESLGLFLFGIALYFATGWGLLLLTGLAFLVVAYLLLRRKKRLHKWMDGTPESEAGLLLMSVERRLARRGLVRGEAETPRQFAQRIEADAHESERTSRAALARWYCLYSDLHYGQRITTDSLETLRRAAKDVWKLI